MGDWGSIAGSGRSPGGGYGNPLRILAWRTLWTEEPGGLQSMVSIERLTYHVSFHFAAFKETAYLDPIMGARFLSGLDRSKGTGFFFVFPQESWHLVLFTRLRTDMLVCERTGKCLVDVWKEGHVVGSANP